LRLASAGKNAPPMPLIRYVSMETMR